MATKTVETASPEHYLRLMLVRLLETQKCLAPIINQPALAPVKEQYLVNSYTLSEIESWLRTADEDKRTGRPPSSVPGVEIYGPDLLSPPTFTQAAAIESGIGLRSSPFAWNAPPTTATPFQVRSSLPSSVTLPDSAQIIGGIVTFRPPSSPEKPSST